MVKKLNIPPIGLRIIKSALGIFLCYCVNLLRNGQGIVFYSQLAVLWCIQDYISGTLSMAKQRMIGTVIGALYGLAALFLFKQRAFSYEPDENIALLLRGMIIALFIVLTLYTTVLIKRKNASYFSCVVFLSIIVNHLGDSNPYLFVWNRFLDTIIGIGLGVVINCFSLPRVKHREILFVSGIDDTLLDRDNNLSAFERVELNRIIEDGAMFTVSTMRTPATIMESLGQIRLELPAIVMNGAALYNFSEKRYLKVFTIETPDSERVIHFLEERRQPYFANIIVEDLLIINYQETDSVIYNRIIGELRRSPYRNYVDLKKSVAENIVYFMLIDHTEKIEQMYRDLYSLTGNNSSPFRLRMMKYPSTDYPGYSYIKIYHEEATRENMLIHLEQIVPCERVVTFGTVPGKYDHLIEPGDPDRVVKLMKKLYEPLSVFGSKQS